MANGKWQRDLSNFNFVKIFVFGNSIDYKQCIIMLSNANGTEFIIEWYI